MKRARSFLETVEASLDTVGRYLGRAGTVGKLAQAAPVVVSLLVVFFSPSAWLSATLRRWALGGTVVGAALGALLLARVGVRTAHKQGLAFVALVALLVAGGLLRLHLAIADVLFVERWSLLAPLHDLYLGSDAGETAFDLVTALGFAVVVASATLGLPVLVAWLRERREAAAAKRPDATATIARTLRELQGAVARQQQRLDETTRQRDALAAELAALRRTAPDPADGTSGADSSEGASRAASSGERVDGSGSVDERDPA